MSSFCHLTSLFYVIISIALLTLPTAELRKVTGFSFQLCIATPGLQWYFIQFLYLTVICCVPTLTRHLELEKKPARCRVCWCTIFMSMTRAFYWFDSKIHFLSLHVLSIRHTAVFISQLWHMKVYSQRRKIYFQPDLICDGFFQDILALAAACVYAVRLQCCQGSLRSPSWWWTGAMLIFLYLTDILCHVAYYCRQLSI
jgi:hypothetical protein